MRTAAAAKLVAARLKMLMRPMALLDCLIKEITLEPLQHSWKPSPACAASSIPWTCELTQVISWDDYIQ